ncbi:MAG: hypothetical protein KDA33_16445, partial [Phycisphaerales bacterium]|nr:hypothetical protein [Phycisphaerales bacterium]
MFSRPCLALAMIACCAPAGVHAEPRPDVDWQVGGHTFRVREIAVSPDGLRAASGAEDSSLKIWDIASGKLELTVAVPSEFSPNIAAIFGVTFDPSGDSIWGASVGGAYEWDAHTGAFIRAIGAVETGEHVFFSRDGEYVGLAGSASGFDDDTFVFRRSDGAFLHMFEPAGSVAATFTADSAFVIAGSAIAFQQMSGDIRYYRMSDGGLERTIDGAHIGAVNWIELSPDGVEFASCGDDGVARLWNVADGALRHTLSGHSGPIQRVHYSPDGAEIATSSHDGTIRVWDAQSGAFLRMMTPLGGEGVGPLAWTSDGASMIVSAGSHFGSPSPHVRQIAATDGALQKQFTHFERQFNDLALAPDGSRVAMSVYPARVHVFDAIDGTPLWISPDDSQQNYIAFTPDSARLAIGRANGVVD